ncbi:sensor domain-containing protein [Aquihabitans sp. G128]|uniref:sensor histidine kinase n=1 Tax=Aquihabitans sp. G128 TaxID=2849779 RepID=UPI001C236987|nr:sensor histidine kinase [Aquihabitans sp. G128]QXC62179.1 sensor domain-containing protein [Aquihabitans sp. G128]
MTSSAPILTRAYRPVVSSATWRATAKVFLDLPVVWATGLAVLIPAVVAVPTAIVFPVSLAFAVVSLVGNRLAARWDRQRLAVFLDLELPSPWRPRTGGPWKRFTGELGDGATWRALAYRAAAIPLAAVAGLLVLVAWSVPVTALTAPAWVWFLPKDRIDLGPLHLTGLAGALPAVLLGVLLVPVAPVLVAGVAHVERWVGRLLLGPRGEAALAERIEQVETSRARVVDAAEVERRRIERDLHDGAQQRLVALAMNLGMAKEKFATDPAAAQALVEEAHAESKRALVELRDLARGLHPAVLTDRGLGPALSAVAARSPVPVEVRLHLAARPDATTEGIAYFVVCEALANVAKHSQAAHATVTVSRVSGRLVVEVTDDGIGGADLSGSGLVGLRDRVQAVDGWLQVLSPPGGPTTILAELPCAS